MHATNGDPSAIFKVKEKVNGASRTPFQIIVMDRRMVGLQMARNEMKEKHLFVWWIRKLLKHHNKRQWKIEEIKKQHREALQR